MVPGGAELLAPVHAFAGDHYVLPETPNGRGADALGMRPRGAGLETRAMLEAARDGKLAVLVILGANPMLRFPDRALVEAALRATPFVVVTELFMTETAEFANLVLPVCSAFEKSGTTTDLAGDVLPVAGSVRAPEGLLADGDVIVELAERLNVALPMPHEIEARVRELVRTPPPEPAAGELRVIAEQAIFTGGGTLAFDARIADLRARPRATVHPDTAAAHGVADGDLVDLTGTNGAVLRGLAVIVDPRVPPAAVALLDGIPAAPLNALGDSAVRLEKALVTA
jgi:anaerobic selenocysteine-containing dehydrogenase